MTLSATARMTGAEQEIYRLLRESDEPVRRSTLIRETGLDDRQVRDVIADLRSKHRVRIVGGRGYWIAESDSEVLDYTAREIKKGATTIRHMRELERSLDVHPRLPLEGNGDRPVAAKQSRGTATCDLCGALLSGRQERWCSDWCRQTYWGRRAS